MSGVRLGWYSMAKIVVLELGFENDEDAEEFADAAEKHELTELSPGAFRDYSVIECRVENP
jgi:hypothetical protein